ncbi:Alpha/beta hydrolase fold-1 [Fusarium oxysporum f. sp. vasinfectum]|nr:Alpha/beta hydrolase fold-1 [Fusarium oxysporum f. sp. vasinfectum]KAK2931437.1 Alpha/beta hydrolase fold-1 [Fusarium oxysporum f. sp. vasinfectum]
MSEKPVLLFVHGAWHPPKCYDAIKTALTNLGYECVIPKLPSVGSESHGVTWEADKAKIIETAEPFFNQGREVVLIAHSYGGIPRDCRDARSGNGRACETRLEWWIPLDYFLSCICYPGQGLGSHHDFWWGLSSMVAGWRENQITRMAEGARESVYSGCTEEAIDKALESTEPHSQDAFETSLDFIAADITIPKTYIICENDQLILLPLQEKLVESTPGMRSARLAAGHSPFVEKTEETAELIVKIIEEEV